jgi:hypothetical protein
MVLVPDSIAALITTEYETVLAYVLSRMKPKDKSICIGIL